MKFSKSFIFLVGVGSCSAATFVGGGSGLSGVSGADGAGGDRLNVHQMSTNLGAGTYNVDNWSVNVFSHDGGAGGNGTITPMLLTGTPSSYTTIWVGTSLDPTATGVQTISQSGTFTLAGATDVYAGFFTENEGSDITGIVFGTGITSHDSVFSAPTGVGQTVDNFTNPTLGRTYAFDVSVSPIPEPSSLSLLALMGLSMVARRKR